jgi:hypothetical protein
MNSFKQYCVLGFENFGSFLVLIQNKNKKTKKRGTISNFLVFGAAKSMNSCKLSLKAFDIERLL